MALTHGLALWQQCTLAIFVIVIFGWAVFMSAAYALTRGNAQLSSRALAPAVDDIGPPLIEAPTVIAPWLREVTLEERERGKLRMAALSCGILHQRSALSPRRSRVGRPW